MTTRLRLGISAIAALILLASDPPPKAASAASFRQGVNVLLYGDDDAVRSKAQRLVSRLRLLGVTHVSLALPIYQKNARSSTVRRVRGRTPSNATIEAFVREARRHHIRVAIGFLLDEESLRPEWRGSIRPAAVGQWFASYSRLLSGLTRTATRSGASEVVIGIELKSLEGYESAWRRMIATIDRAFTGRLRYNLNWSSVGHGRVDPWLGSLDLVGVDAYFPLRAPADASVRRLLQALNRWSNGMAVLAGDHPKQRIVLSEVGIRAERGAFRQPWGWSHETGLDLAAQARYYAAYCRWAHAIGSAGLYWWVMDLDAPTHPVRDPGFNPLGKPAEGEIQKCFRG
jgi:hypothetical protein